MGQLRPSAIVGQITGKTQTAAFRRGKGGRMYVNNYVKRTSKLAGIANVQKRWMMCVAKVTPWWSLMAKAGKIATQYGSAQNGLTKAIYPVYANGGEERFRWYNDTDVSSVKEKIEDYFSTSGSLYNDALSEFTPVFQFLQDMGGAIIAKGTNSATVAVSCPSAGSVKFVVSHLDGLTTHKVDVYAIDAATGVQKVGHGVSNAAGVTLTGFVLGVSERSAGYNKYAGIYVVVVDGKPITKTVSQSMFKLTAG